MKTIAITASALAFVAASAFAQDALDADVHAEGPWTQEELMMEYPEVTPELFVQIDTDGDGVVTQEELDAAIDAGLIQDTM